MGNLQIPEFAVRTFDKRWELVTQQMTSKLRDKCTVDEFEGKQKVYNDLNTLAWQEDTTRFGDSNPQEVTGDKRVLTKRNFSCMALFDRNDTNYIVKELTTPGSDTEMAMQASWSRSVDDLIIAGASGTVYGGAEPYVTPITLPGNRSIAVNYVPTGSPTNSGLTIAKIRSLAKQFELDDVMMGENTISGADPMCVYLAIGPKQKENLLAYVDSAPNAPFATMIGDAMMGKGLLFGFKVVITNRLQYASNIRTCLAWSPMGVKIVPDKYEINVDRLAEKKHAIQLAAYTTFGTMRRFEKHVGQIYCDESV
jgi:hypothetical protein